MIGVFAPLDSKHPVLNCLYRVGRRTTVVVLVQLMQRLTRFGLLLAPAVHHQLHLGVVQSCGMRPHAGNNCLKPLHIVFITGYI